MPLYARLWTDILDDPKLRLAVDEGAKHLVLLPWLIAWAKRADAEGRIEISGKTAKPRQIAKSIPNTNARSVAKSLEELEAIGIVSKDADGCYRFAAWDYRNSGKTSDSKEAVAERVRKHRERKRAERNADVTPRNALQALPDVTDVTSKRVESREEREESREKRHTAGSREKDSTSSRTASRNALHPPAAPHPPFDHPDVAAFGRMFYGAAPADRIRDVKRQIRASMNGRGAQLRKGVHVYAGSLDRLAAKCREVIADPPRDYDRAIVVLLTKLADVSDDSPTDRAAEEIRAEVQRDEAETAREWEHALAWLRENPIEQQDIDKSANEQTPASLRGDDSDFAKTTRQIVYRSVVLRAWRAAGSPVLHSAGSS